MNILFCSGFGPVVRDVEAARRLYAGDLGIAFKVEEGNYLHTEKLAGVKTFALWPLEQVAQSCFGTPVWPEGLRVPQSWIEFDMDDVEAATRELAARGYTMLVSARMEPWGQTVSRFLSPEGMVIGITYTPWMREGASA